jgi:hypothetical protein
MTRFGVVFPLLLSLAGCAATEGGPTRQYVLGESASLCFSDDARRAEALLSAAYIQEVVPLYAHLSSRGNWQARLRGASIRLRPTIGLSRESLLNAVECRRQVAGLDPFGLPEHRMRVSIDSSDGSFVVNLSSSRIEDAKLVLARAYALVGQTSEFPAE